MLTLHGTPTSTFCTTCRMVLGLKAFTDFTVEPNAPHTSDQDAHHPWGKVPAMTHDGFTLYETAAITRYLDEVLPGPSLQPAEIRGVAQMTQYISAYCDNVPRVTFPVIIGRLIVPGRGGVPDEDQVAKATAAAPATLAVFDRALRGRHWLVGDQVSLADLFLVPNIVFFRATPEGREVMNGLPDLSAMVDRAMAIPALAATMTA